MGASELLDSKITEMQESIKDSNQTLGALFVLVRLALAEAESAGAKDAVNTLQKADALILRGHLNGGLRAPNDIVFGRD